MPPSRLQVVSFLAVPLGLYQAAGVVALAQVAGVWPPRAGDVATWTAWATALAYSLCVGMGVYLLDRVKLRDAWLDPADAVAHPERAEFLARHSGCVRVLMVALFVAGGVAGAVVSWWLVAMLVAAVSGVLVYAGRPRTRRARPKDVLVLKNVCVGAAMTAFAAVVVGVVASRAGSSASEWTAERVGAAALAIANIFVRVLCDAILCDLDDEHADRAFATATLATRFGRSRAWDIAMALRMLLGLAMLLTPVGGVWSPGSSVWRARVAWGVVTIASSVVTRIARPRNLRDWVDWRFGVEVIAVAGILAS